MNSGNGKYLRIGDLVPGLILGKAAITADGTVMLSEGTVLTASLIERLRQWGILDVYICIEDSSSTGQEKPAVFDLVASVSSAVPQKVFAEQYEEAVRTLHKVFDTIRYLKELPLDTLRELADNTVANLLEVPGALNHLHMVKGQDDYTFRHSLNVAMIAGLLGKWMDYPAEERKALILAGLMHDIGKAQIPLELLNKPSRLLTSEMDLMKKHTTRGYNLVKEHKDIPAGVVYGILQHHERMDGSGYPLGVPGEKIHPFARIVAIADIYDAMTSERAYQKGTSPFEVVQTLMQEMFDKLDPEICTSFLNNVRDFFVGNIVMLNNGQMAEVSYIAQVVGAAPIVRTSEGEFLDLGKRKDIKIMNVVKS